ncbi:MAG: hypothetical protein PW789_04975 [Edaphobacter sp.]|uniref:hypothetical protein n=1 Tax=Edaphobacter sp. TaxID=1934404 RepID=UPI00239CC5CC|nr:hypothetical protein [Edaphobacter sp.]MDE1175941.1 hypothetical protein [Edaphobacter sp.]
MDSVRFGRALGFGARAAAKTLVAAVDAASAPNPTRPATGQAPRPAAQTVTEAPGQSAQPTRRSAEDVVQQVARAATQVKQTTDGLNQHGRQLQQSVMAPVKRLSGVLWLEFTGSFFGLFAVSAASAAWKLRGALHETPGNHDAHTKLLVAILICVLFSYFCASSFVRAKRRERAR